MTNKFSKVIGYGPWFAVLLAALGHANKVSNYDIWWHIRTGRWIWEHHEIPSSDLFSYTAQGTWRNTEALAQLYFFFLDRLGGAVAISVAELLLVFLLGMLVLFLLRSNDPKPTPGAETLTLFVWAIASHFRLGAKPEVFTFLCFTVLLLQIRRSDNDLRIRRLLFLPLVFAVWGYLHRGGTVGVIVLGIAILRWSFERRTRPLAARAFPVLAACVGALLLNPAGGSYITAAFDLGSSASYRALIPEWSPIPLSFLFTPVGATFVLALLIWAADEGIRRRLDSETLIGITCVALAFHAIRFIPIASIALAPGVARGFDRMLSSLRRLGISREKQETGSVAVALLSIVSGSVLATPRGSFGLGMEPGRFPVQASAFLAAHPAPGNMWNNYDFGGYLIYALGPRVKVFIDGRLETVYSPDFFVNGYRAEKSSEDFDALVEKYEVGYVVMRPMQDLRWLHERTDWVTVFLDDAAEILVRYTPESQRYVEEFGYRELRVDTAFNRAKHLETDPNRSEFEQDVIANARRAPDALSSNLLLAFVYRARGLSDEYTRAKDRCAKIAAERGLKFKLP
jgi:hypothetical protein